MRVQPEAENAVSIILDDGTSFKLHNTIHGGKSYLFVRSNEGLQIDTMVGLDWQPLIQTNFNIRLSDFRKEVIHK